MCFLERGSTKEELKGLRGKITGVSENAHYIPLPVHGESAANDPYSNEIVIETG